MGEMADYALNEMYDDDDRQQRLINVPFHELNDDDREFMYDEHGVRYPLVFGMIGRKHTEKPSGPGPCPVCGCSTKKLTNKSTKQVFYGCSQFPQCKGSRNGF